jgi:flagellar protein FlaG
MDVKNICQGGHATFHVNTNSLNNDSIEALDSPKGETRAIENNNLESKGKIKEQDVKKAVDKLNKLFEDKSTHAEYEVYGKFKDITISIVDNNTKEVVKEIPPKKIIDMVDKLCELAGMFMDQKA